MVSVALSGLVRYRVTLQGRRWQNKGDVIGRRCKGDIAFSQCHPLARCKARGAAGRGNEYGFIVRAKSGWSAIE